MGAYQIWHIEFKDKRSRKYFESLKLHKKILCSYCCWKDKDVPEYLRTGDVTYFMGWDGYAFGSEFLNKHLKNINIKKFYSLDLSCRTDWYNELKKFVPWNEGCGLIVAKTKDSEIKCGENMLGKKRYCAYCQNIIKNADLTKEVKE